MAAGEDYYTLEGEKIVVQLQEADLWSKFHTLTNEMIVTKNGRRMFPVIKTMLSGLEPTTFYSVLLEFRQIESTRWKYINGDWLAG
jgi:brachyury protein